MAALGFGPDRISTLISMATGSPPCIRNGYHGENTLSPSFLIEAGNKEDIKSRMSSNFGKIRPGTKDLAAPGVSGKVLRLIIREML